MSNYIEYNDTIAFHPGYYIKEIVYILEFFIFIDFKFRAFTARIFTIGGTEP